MKIRRREVDSRGESVVGAHFREQTAGKDSVATHVESREPKR